MSDTSVTDQGDDSGTWTPPKGAPSPLGQLARSNNDIWNRGRDQPTTVASLGPDLPPKTPPSRFGGVPMFEQPRQSAPGVVRPQPRPWSGQPPTPQQSPPDTPLLSPSGLPPPVRQFTPYIPAMPTRPPDQWGMAPFAPRMPMGFEVPGIFQGVGSWFGQNGSGVTALLGMGGARFAGDFIKSYQQGMEWKTKMQREQMQMHMEQLDEQQKEENDAYAEVFNTYSANDYKDVGGVPFSQALEQVAGQYNDTNMINTLSTSGAGGAYKLMQNRDAKWQDVQAANKQTQKETDEAEVKNEWGDTSPTSAPATTAPTGRFGPPSGGPPGTTPAQALPGTPTQAPGTTPTGAGPPGSQPSDGQAENPTHDAGMQILEGADPNKFPTAIRADAQLVASRGHMAMTKAIDDVNKGNITPADVEGRINQIDPMLGNILDGVIHYRRGPTSTGSGGGGTETGFWNDMETLAMAAHPGWSQSTYRAVMNFRDSAQTPTSPIQRIPTAVSAANNALSILDQIQKRDGGSALKSPEDFQAALGKDPLWSRFKLMWTRYNEDVDVIARGSASVTMTEQGIQAVPQVPYLGSIASYRSTIAGDMDQVASRTQTLHGTWDQYGTGDPMPGYSPQSETDMKAISQVDPNTGARPGQTIQTPLGF